MPEVFSRNTRHEEWHTSKHLSLLCIATHMPSAHTSDKNRYRIFLCHSILREFSLWAQMWDIDLNFIENVRV